MESFGQILRETRERKNLTVDQVARDTRISRRYLEALEQEDFSVFPGETYLVGFLRNYAEYLSLNREELVTIYRNMRIQEQPLPMEELLHARRAPAPGVVILLAVAGVAALGGAGYGLWRVLGPRVEAAQEPAAAGETVAEQVTFQTDGLTQWFEEGDGIIVPMGERRHGIEISTISDRRVVLVVPGGTIRMSYSEDRFVDLDLDSKPDVRIVFNDIDLLAVPKRVNLGLTKLRAGEQAAVVAAAPEAAGGAAGAQADPLTPRTEGETAVPPPAAQPTPAAPPTAVAPRPVAVPVETTGDRQVILIADSPSVFAVKVDFRGSTLFRYLQDGERREQRFFQKAETFSVDNVSRRLQLWISNAGAVRLTVEGREVPVGRSGQVVSKLISWEKDDESGRYRLEVGSVF